MVKRKILIIDYGVGNVQSVFNAVTSLGWDVLVSSQLDDVPRADAFILPGVGAFGTAMKNLHQQNIVEVLSREVLERKKPLLGICLGMQLLAETSEEDGVHHGLAWLPARVVRLEPGDGLRVPHVGWNRVDVVRREPLFSGLNGDHSYYFVHSYVFACDEAYVSARFHYGVDCVAAVQKDNIFGTLFHPEKSSATGLHVLRNFLRLI